MKDNRLISFSIPESKLNMNPEEIEKMQFTKVHFRIYSADRVNAHNYTCSLKVLKKYSNTISGKPILVWYNKFANNGNGDFTGHEDNSWAKEYPVGFFPENTKVTYEKDEDGTIFLCADGYIWNVYYSEIVKVFEDYGGIKGISCEMLVLDSELIEDTDIENILQYSFTGVTLIGEHDALGIPIKPAVDGCQGILVTNSSTNAEYEKAKKEFQKILCNSAKVESENTDSFFNAENKEEQMEENINKDSSPTNVVENAVVDNTVSNNEVIDNATQETTTSVSVSKDTWNYDDDGHYVGGTYENHYVSTTEVKEVDENEVKQDEGITNNTEVIENSSSCEQAAVDNTAEATNACKTENSVSVEDYDKLKVKCTALEEELKEKKSAYDALMIKYASLEEYKKNKENENMKTTIELVLNSVSHILSPEQISDWRKESEKYSAESVDEFTNKLKAFAFDVQEKSGVIQKDSMRNSLPKEVDNEPTDFWERIDKKYK